MRYLLSRFRRLVLVLFAVTFLTFLLVNALPGDIAYELAGGMDASEELVEQIREELGLNQAVIVRYVKWLGAFLVGDWGVSYRTGEPVVEAIFSRLPVSIELMIAAVLMTLLLAIPLGILSAYRAGRSVDRAVAVLGFLSLSIPAFAWAILLILFFALTLGVLPATGYVPITEDLWGNLRAFILPGFAIALADWTGLMRVLRADMIGVLQEDYIAMARAKGLSSIRIMLVHALRPSSFSMTTLLGLQIGGLIGGALIVETIFALPGVGRLLVNAVYTRDFIIVQGVVTFIAVGYVLVNVGVDVVYTLLDPRVRVAGARG